MQIGNFPKRLYSFITFLSSISNIILLSTLCIKLYALPFNVGLVKMVTKRKPWCANQKVAFNFGFDPSTGITVLSGREKKILLSISKISFFFKSFQKQTRSLGPLFTFGGTGLEWFQA